MEVHCETAVASGGRQSMLHTFPVAREANWSILGIPQGAWRVSLTVQVWADVRGGKLENLMCNNMMTCAADITGQDTLDRAAFAKLCKHFTQA